MQQIQTHKGPSDKSLCRDKAPSVKSIPTLFHQEDAAENYPFSIYIGNIYLQMCVWLFHFSVTWFSEMQFGMLYFKGVAHNPMLHSQHLCFVLVSLFLA